MPNTLLTEFQGACRAAHEQVQMLQDLYEHLCGPESHLAAASTDADNRLAELRDLEEVLSQRLKEQDLLPKQPDPERESLLELITGMKATVTGEEQPAADERLATEETELLQHIEKMLEHGEDAALEEARGRTRDAIARLSGTATGTGGKT
jgi:hypothetical protein